MRRALWLGSVLALAGLGSASPAGADVLDDYQRLAERGLTPAPLVPTTVPPILSPIDRTIELGTTIGGRGYSIRVVRTGPDANIVVTGGEFKRMQGLRREYRRLGFRGRRMRVRGRRGYLFTRRLTALQRQLVWVEGGVIYTVGSGTPRRISLANLRATARRLDRLQRDWIGGSSDPDDSSGGVAVTTRRTVSVDVRFEGKCVAPGSTDGYARVGQAGVTLMRRNGNGFAFEIAEHRYGSGEWAGTVTGTISASAITLNLRATGTIEGDVCDTGPVTLTLDRRAS